MTWNDPMNCALAVNVALVAPIIYKTLDLKACYLNREAWKMRTASEVRKAVGK